MKKMTVLLLSLALLLIGTTALADTAPSAATVTPLTLGSVTTYDFGAIKLHSYSLGDALADECYLVESDEGLVMLETGAFTANLVEWKGYIDSLGKPVAGALLAYHPNGMENFGDVTVYTTENALASWGEGGSIRALTDSFVAGFGDAVAANHPADATLVSFGDTVTLAGVDFIIRDEGDAAFGVEIPAINCVYIHMLGSDCHNILTSKEHINAFIAELEGFTYDLVLTSHYAPEGEDAVATKIAYLRKVLELADSCADADAFTAAMNEAFPEAKFVPAESSLVEPFFGKRFLRRSILALCLALVLILVYEWITFRKIGGLAAGLTALAALFHDLLMVFFTCVIARIPIGDTFVAVALSIIGYSINDTIVIFDRIRENRRTYPKLPVETVADLSIRQSMMRSINTNVAVTVAVAAIYLLAGRASLDSVVAFALPMTVGSISGCYSTLCLAGPLWILWQERIGRKAPATQGGVS